MSASNTRAAISGAESRAAVPILRRHLAEGARSLLGWSVALAAVLALYLPVYPSLQTPELADILDTLPTELVSLLGYDQIATGAGYAQATFFGLLGFALGAIAATAWGARFIAGMEESGRLELTLAHAVGRVQYVAETAAALVIRVLGLSLVTVAVLLVLNPVVELALSIPNVLAATASWAGLAVLSGTAALAAGALTGRSAWSLGAGATVAALGYALNAIGGMSADLDWLVHLSPYYWAFGEHPLSNGFDWGGLALLWGFSALLVAVACVALSRRDIGR
ncbi:ABC transporter permease subunit [Actinomyces succiniciruminis]|uniref:ABC super ATP binding cassette transporter, permease protein n=1 Tax=Actinomyces succiniciruminis TaxID=1522002 RepID=A0A1L7RR08_9ACTO|nr:ABC transporter permease subunit [Actinomyces succiniciruminis]CED91593.1 ABC super ATP binding cassette transporter, permease protein [Actinomyces succiniciruminis]